MGKKIIVQVLLGLGQMRNLGKKFNRTVRQFRVCVVMLMACGLMLLSGCIQYDLEVKFDSQTQGKIVQRIQIGERLKAFSNETARLWLESIQHRSRELQGNTQQISDEEILVTIPFNNGAELADKMNQFMNPVEQKSSGFMKESGLGLPEVSSHMSLTQKNRFFLLRNQLSYDLDFRSLGVISTNGNLLISPGALLDLKFALRTPWGATMISGEPVPPVADPETEISSTPDSTTPEIRDRGRTLVWTLQPGELNHIEVVFWVPSPIGIGAGIIALFIAISMFVKYLLSPVDDLPGSSPSIPEVAEAEPAVSP